MVLFSFVVDETKCMNCGACMDLCPTTALEFSRAMDTNFYGSLYGPTDGVEEGRPKPWMMEKPFLSVQERCTGCQICARECPTNAITVKPDTSQPPSAKPKPMTVKVDGIRDDGHWHPLSEYTRDYRKHPVGSAWSNIAAWKPMPRDRGIGQTWRTMKKKE
jgi:NAD-dependent dihydropyrimidine dehydrogenase PreA subunit